MRLVQHLAESGKRCVSQVVDDNTLAPLGHADSVYSLAHRAAAESTTLEALAAEFVTSERLDYQAVIDAGWLLPAIDHPVDEAHCMVSGTGLTYLGAGAVRAALLERLRGDIDAAREPALALLAAGAARGKPAEGLVGAQPEWFYKGDGGSLLAAETPLARPMSAPADLASGVGLEAEIAAIYVIDGTGRPARVGYALANETTDHPMEHANSLYLGHAKLRHTPLGPELLLGELPARISGEARIVRDGEAIWQQTFLAGTGALTHSIHNLEHHHFKYSAFRRPGDVHVHCLGAAASSGTDSVVANDGDRMEIEAEGFGRPLRTTVATTAAATFSIRQL